MLVLGRPGFSKNAVNANELLGAVTSRNCTERYNAVISFIRTADVGAISDLQEHLVKEAPGVLSYLWDAFVYLKSIDLAARRTESLLENIFARLDSDEIQTSSNAPVVEDIDKRKAELLGSTLVEAIDAQSDLVNQAFLVGIIVQQLVHYFPRDESKPVAAAIESFLSGADSNLRICAASAVALSDYPTKVLKTLVPILLRGLESEEFIDRYYSQIALVALGKRPVCFNPLDSVTVRAEGIREWETWWKEWVGRN